MQVCTACGQEKPFADFAPDARRSCGHQRMCRPCQRARYHSAEQKAARRRKSGEVSVPYVPKHEQIAAAAVKREQTEKQRAARASSRITRPAKYSSAWQATATSEQMAEYRARNQAAWQKRYTSHGPAERERAARYKHANPDKAEAWQGRRTAIAAARDDGTMTREAVGKMFADAKRCPYCGDRLESGKKSLDHIIPLSRCGAHSIVNALICCQPCNMRKSNRPFSSWVGMLAAPYANRMTTLYRKRFGVGADQVGLAFTFARSQAVHEAQSPTASHAENAGPIGDPKPNGQCASLM